MSLLPPKVLQLLIFQSEDVAFWSDPANPGPWEGFTYQWKLTGTVPAPQYHSSIDTRVPFSYDSNDINVGDWLSDNSGNCVRVVSLDSADGYNFVIIVEDVDRYNTFKDPTVSGYGGLGSPECICFSLSAEGYPEVGGISGGYFNNVAVDNIQSRFFGQNLVSAFVTVLQPDHGFVVGDFIQLNSEIDGYKICGADDVNLAVGIINTIGIPGTDYFTFRAMQTILEDVAPELEGEYGDIFYMDPANPGKVTKDKPLRNAKPVYIRLETGKRAVRLNAIVDDTGSDQVSIVVTPTDAQTAFTLPQEATDVLIMSINGIETKNFTFDKDTKVLTFDPDATGYGVDSQDEVLFIYQA